MTTLVPFEINQQALTEFREFFLSCYGPWGTLKTFVTEAGALRITATSNRIVQLVDQCIDETKFPLGSSILHVVKGHLSGMGDGGLLMAGLACDLIIRSDDLVRCRGTLEKVLLEAFAASRLKIELSDVHQVLTVVRSIFGSKKLMSSKQVEVQSVKLLEAFLKTLSDDHADSLVVKVKLGREFSTRLLEGFLHRFPEGWEYANRPSEGRVVVINFQMKECLSETSEMASLGSGVHFQTSSADRIVIEELAGRLIDFCLSMDVKIVANQKVVCQNVKARFASSGIFIFERLGKVGAKRFSLLANCSVATSLETLVSSDGSGYIGTVDKVTVTDDFLHFENSNSPCATLVVTHHIPVSAPFYSMLRLPPQTTWGPTRFSWCWVF